MEKRISVIIPNYNGKHLLEKNLPLVVKNCSGCDIIVVDDASTDGSVEFLKHKFRKVRVIRQSKNSGFATAVNLGVEKARSSFVLLLNSDVSPRQNFLKIAIKHFGNEKLFAVGLQDYSHENGKIVVKGRGGMKFKRGFFLHFPAFIERGTTLWVSGGSGLFNRDKFLQLGGFDPIFKPFYWEDIDLSFRAWRSGYSCIFEPLAKVDHYHEEGAITTQKSQFYIQTVSYKNQFIFTWKNVSNYLWVLEHLLWLPYHMVRAIISLNFAFVTGLIWAILLLPNLIRSQHLINYDYKFNDKEVIEVYDRP
jgi:GT2 family glycosyltransferase